MLLYAATVFLSAFLLFLVQPLLAKQILPWFGGVAAVWAICLVFFQSVLLLGYAYADWTTRCLGPPCQGGGRCHHYSGTSLPVLRVVVVIVPRGPAAGQRAATLASVPKVLYGRG